MIRNIVFDMGNVLFDFNPHLYMQPYQLEEADRDLLRHEIFGSVEWVRYDRGAISEEEALTGITAKLPQRLHETARHIFLHWHEMVCPNEATCALAVELQERGYKVYLLSNAARNFYTFRKHLSVLERFDGIFVSCDWKLLKPDPAIFRAFCAHFSLTPAQCYFIDDSPINMEGAYRAGLAGSVFYGNVELLRSRLDTDLLEK